MNRATEKQLISRAKKGELSSFEELVSAYEHRVFVLALRFCGNESAAAEITQDVFLETYRSLKGLRGDGSLSSWLYRVTVQRCFERARAGQKPQVSPMEDAQAASPLPDTSPAAVPFDALQSILAQLSGEHRQVLLLRDVAGLTYTEIAQLLSLEDGVVKTRLAQARRQFRDLMNANTSASLPKTSTQTEGRAER